MSCRLQKAALYAGMVTWFSLGPPAPPKLCSGLVGLSAHTPAQGLPQSFTGLVLNLLVEYPLLSGVGFQQFIFIRL